MVVAALWLHGPKNSIRATPLSHDVGVVLFFHITICFCFEFDAIPTSARDLAYTLVRVRLPF